MNLNEIVSYIKNKYKDYNVDCGYDEARKLGIWINSNYGVSREANMVIDDMANDIIDLVDNTKYEFDSITDRMNRTRSYGAYALIVFDKINS